MAMTQMKQQANIFRMVVIGLTLLLIWGEVRQAEAGCQRFGHSCFGAHGKRAEIPSSGLESPEAGLAYNNRPSEYYDAAASPVNYQAINRMSPYLIDWIMSMHRGELRQPMQFPREEAERRRK